MFIWSFVQLNEDKRSGQAVELWRELLFLEMCILGLEVELPGLCQRREEVTMATSDVICCNPCFQVLNGKLFFSGTKNYVQYDLYVTDGTPAVQLTNSTVSSSYSPDDFTPVNGIMFFTASDAAAGRELWRTDGTIVNTYRIKDIRAGSIASDPSFLSPFNAFLLFSVLDGVTLSPTLWFSDGSLAGS